MVAATPPDAPDNKSSSELTGGALTPDVSAGGASTPVAPTPAGEEPLPEWEALTPEFMEDECLRGDFMLRWAVILLSLLLGWTYITETSILVDIRSGEYLLANGLLPPRHDVFSTTATDRPWVNLHWLSDLLLGGVHSWLGMSWLSVLSAITLAATFYSLSRIGVPGVSTWWGSICSAVALIAVFPVVQPGAATFTLLGLALLLWGLQRWDEKPECRWLWGLPVLFLLWTNLDARAWLGLLVLLAFVIGMAIRGRRAVDAEGRHRRQPWLIAGVAFAVGLLATPWPVRPALAFQSAWTRAQELRAYAGSHDFFPQLTASLLEHRYWDHSDVFLICGGVLLVVSAISWLLNARQPHAGWLLAWVAINLASLPFGDIACYAALLNAAVAIRNGQEWQRRTFSQAYSVALLPVLWARGGRAVTVLLLFGLAYVALNGTLMGAGGRRIGVGLDPRWRNRIASLEESVLNHSYTANVFPTLPDVGDLAIWLGRKPFIDSRLALYAENGDNLLTVHRDIRGAMFNVRSEENQETPAVDWATLLQKYETYDVVLRLWGDFLRPDAPPRYDQLFQLLRRPEWALTGLGAAGANFTRSDLSDPALQQHVEANRATRFVQASFQPGRRGKLIELSATFPLPVSQYDRWLIQKIPMSPAPAELARHYDEIRNRLGQFLSPQQATALTYLAIHNARRALQENPDHPLAYRVLSHCYAVLSQVEQLAGLAAQGLPAPSFRYAEALAAAFHASQASGAAEEDMLQLFQMLYAQRKLDAAFFILRYIPLRPAPPEGEEDPQAGLREAKEALQKHLTEVQEKLDEARAAGADQETLVQLALAGNCPNTALALLDEDLTQVEQNPGLKLLRATLLMGFGQNRTAWEQLEGMERTLPVANTPPDAAGLVSQWRNSTAIINIAAGNAARAEELWRADQRAQLTNAAHAALQQPFASAGVPVQQDLWAASAGRVAVAAHLEAPERWALLELQRALAKLEQADLVGATESLRRILEVHPQYSDRGVVLFYLAMLTNQDQPIERPEPSATRWPDMYEDESIEDARSRAARGETEPASQSEPTSPGAESKPAVPGDSDLLPSPVPLPRELEEGT